MVDFKKRLSNPEISKPVDPIAIYEPWTVSVIRDHCVRRKLAC